MRNIPLTKGQQALVDDEDYERLAQYNWHAAKQPNTYYACRTIKPGGKKRTIWMHREINGTPDGLKTDHIDGNGLNNTRSNLRSVTHQDNMINNARHTDKRPVYRGVSWHKRINKWVAQITVDGKNHWLGSFDTPELARDVYEARRLSVRMGKVIRD